MIPPSSTAFRILVQDAIAIGANPHDWALLIYSESTWTPTARNAAGYYGLNQIGANELRAVGWLGGVDAWLATSVEGQLPYVDRFFKSKMTGVPGPIAGASAGHMYAANFLPGRVRAKADPSDVDYPLCVRGELDSKGKRTNFYEQNAVFDVDGKGTITIRDMSNTLRRRMVQNPKDTAIIVAGVNAALASFGVNSPARRGPTLLDEHPNTVTIGEVTIRAGEEDPTPPPGPGSKIAGVALVLVAGTIAALAAKFTWKV